MPFVFALLLAIFCPPPRPARAPPSSRTPPRLKPGPRPPRLTPSRRLGRKRPNRPSGRPPRPRRPAKRKRPRLPTSPSAPCRSRSRGRRRISSCRWRRARWSLGGEQPERALRINGQEVKLGGFSSTSSPSPGDVHLLCELESAVRRPPRSPPPRSIYVDASAGRLGRRPGAHRRRARQADGPTSDLKPGDWLLVQMKGHAGRGAAEFGIGGSKRRFLHDGGERPPSASTRAPTRSRLADDFDHAEVEFFLKNDFGTASGKGRRTRERARRPHRGRDEIERRVVSGKTGPGEKGLPPLPLKKEI